MEFAIYNGFQHHFPDLGRLLCVRHLSKRDESKLVKLLAKTNVMPVKDRNLVEKY